MAVIQDEQGNNKPIVTDTSHVFDVNGNPLHGELFIGETIASDDVEEIDGFAHESDIESLMDLAWGTAIEITPNITAGYVYEVPAMGVIAGEFRKTANTNNGSIDIRSDCGITYKFLASVPPINGGYTPIHINVVRGEKITFRQFAEINFSDSHIWFQPYVRRS